MEKEAAFALFLNLIGLLICLLSTQSKYKKTKEQHICSYGDTSSEYNKILELKRLDRGETLEEEAKRFARCDAKQNVWFWSFLGAWFNVLFFFGFFEPVFLIIAVVCFIVSKKLFVPQPFL